MTQPRGSRGSVRVGDQIIGGFTREVLYLYPMFEFLCPECKEKVGEVKKGPNPNNTLFYISPPEECPHCGASIDKGKDRIPPDFLRGKNAMMDFCLKHMWDDMNLSQRSMIRRYCGKSA